MNRDQVKGRAKEMAGKVQRKVGEVLGNPKHQVKGLAKEIEGKVQGFVGEVRNDAEKGSDR